MLICFQFLVFSFSILRFLCIWIAVIEVILLICMCASRMRWRSECTRNLGTRSIVRWLVITLEKRTPMVLSIWIVSFWCVVIHCFLLCLRFNYVLADMRKALSRDVHKKSIIPLPHPVHPGENDWWSIQTSNVHKLFESNHFSHFNASQFRCYVTDSTVFDQKLWE
jgi:hypothetical protein